MDIESMKTTFESDGVVVVSEFLSGDAFDEVRINLDRYIRDVVPGLAPEHAYYEDRSCPETLKQLQHMSVDPFFEAYRQNRKWLDLAEALLGEPVEASEPEWFNKPPGTEHATPPHQDNYYFNLVPPNVLTIWMAVDPVDEENGCLRYVPGSHKQGVLVHERSNVLGFSQHISDHIVSADTEVMVTLSPGDAVVHHGNIIHRADANRTLDRHRGAFAMVMRGESCELDEEAFARYQATATKQVRDLG
jgi:phytanoyl-CoA hydroxylase